MIVEIGTSDFDTQAGLQDGLFIEPVKWLFDRLPDCRKEWCAISDYEGFADMFFVPEELIDRHRLPQHVRGCGRLGEVHPVMVAAFEKRKVDTSGIVSERVPVRRIAGVLRDHGIDHVDELKIDAEGCDVTILNDWMDTLDMRPATIVFEDNPLLGDPVATAALLGRLADAGYDCVREGRKNYRCRL